MVEYLNLFDIENRPGSGVALWSGVLERQLERVKEVNYRHRVHHSPVKRERQEQPGAEAELHGEVYFLVLAVRRVALFAEALERQVADERLRKALGRFEQAAPRSREVRNLFEHIDEYLLEGPGRKIKIEGRVAPVLILRWDCDNVVIAYGENRFDVTLAALAAIDLGTIAAQAWGAELERLKRSEDPEDAPETNDGVPRAIEVEMGVSTIIEGGESDPTVRTGRLMDVRLRKISEAEAEELRAREERHDVRTERRSQPPGDPRNSGSKSGATTLSQ